ncbi:hypothetical protein BJX70DRAFT_377478 [Aspergillus crustosus]
MSAQALPHEPRISSASPSQGSENCRMRGPSPEGGIPPSVGQALDLAIRSLPIHEARARATLYQIQIQLIMCLTTGASRSTHQATLSG